MRRSSASGSSTTGWSFTASPSTAIAKAPARSRNWRAYPRLAALALWFLAALPLHLASKSLFRRSDWPRRFLAVGARIAGARVTLVGGPVRGPALLAANHVSWMDILALAGATGCVFVSKDQLGHPFVHWLADQNRTIYVNRTARRAIGEQTATIANALDDDAVVAFFPEGTVGPGTELLPFRPPLFASAAVAAAEVEIRPVAIDYGPTAAEISWFGESGKDNFFRVLGRRGRVPVTIRILDPIAHGERKQLASRAQSAIAASLGFKSDAHSPIAGGE